MRAYNKHLKQPARTLRKNQTDAEEHLWQRIRRKQIEGLQFYRQKPLFNFIVDFYCPRAGLVVECDGSQHHTSEGLAADAERDNILFHAGIKVLRFNNYQILTETEAVCEVIRQAIVANLSKKLQAE